MSQWSAKIGEQMIAELLSSFQYSDNFLLLDADGTPHGCRGLECLRLIFNAVRDAVYREEAARERRVAAVMTSAQTTSTCKLVGEMQSKIDEFKEMSDCQFVMCWHLYGTAAWNLDYSRDLTDRDAVNNLRQFLKFTLDGEM